MAKSKWNEMTDEEKKAHMEKAKEYRYKRKAKDLGISLEEYKARLAARDEGQKVKLKSGKKKVDRVLKERLDRVLAADMRIHKRHLKGKAGEIEAGIKVNRGDDKISVMFRKGEMVLATLHKESPNLDNAERGVVPPIFFISLKDGKMRRLDAETDIKKDHKVAGPDDLKWPASL
ncbi:MAG: hypothetical protein LC687_00200 [Actinobacteria bacterium]|nr:hypothetical protein [Actinomycetota bacterium]MCA1806291.1 hypothetical protein [Actinomycetota bacterium]